LNIGFEVVLDGLEEKGLFGDCKMETVGVYLKKERELRNISLRELSRLSKISPLYLNFIEKDEFDKLPQGPYVKGYITSYSRLIGGNVDEAITLYETLIKKRIQTEEIQSDISSHNGSNGLPDKSKTKAWKKPNGSSFGGVKSLFNTVVSSVPINRFSFKAAGTSIKNIGSAVRINRNWFDIVISFLKKIALSWSWQYAFMALLGSGLLALAGFGFYHLFIYDPNPLSLSQLQQVQNKEARPLPAIGSEKSVLPSDSAKASLTADQQDKDANNKRHAKPTNPPEAKKQAATSFTGPDAAMTSAKSEPVPVSETSNAVTQTNTPLSGSSSEPATADAELNVLQASVCAEIKNRMPAGVATSFPTSAQRVFVWSKIHAQQIPSKVRHVYYFDGQKISEVTLNVRSTYWRTWSSKNISNNRYQGEWRVDITSTDGKILRRLYFEVK